MNTLSAVTRRRIPRHSCGSALFLGIAFLLVGSSHLQAQILQLYIQDYTESSNIFYLMVVGPSGTGTGSAAFSGFYTGLDGKTHNITQAVTDAAFPQLPGHYYEALVTQLDASRPCDFEGLGLGLLFDFGGHTNVVVYPPSLSASCWAYNDSPANISVDLNSHDTSAVFSSYANGTYPWSGVFLFESAGAYGYVSYRNNLPMLELSAFVTASVSQSKGPFWCGSWVDYDLPEVGAHVSFEGSWYITPTGGGADTTPIPLTLRAMTLAPATSASAAGAAGIVPGAAIYPTNSLLPVYYFSNLVSGASCSAPVFGQLDYGYSFQTSGDTRIKTMTLPSGWSGSVVVSASNSVARTYDAGQVIDFSSFPGGGAAQISILGNGFPLQIPTGGFPVALTFNTSQASVAVAPLVLLVSFPPTDQTVAAGGQLSIPISAQSDQSLSYQWQFGDADLAGQTNAVLTIDGVTAKSAGQYRMVMSTVGLGSTNTWYSPEANVTVVPGPSIATISSPACLPDGQFQMVVNGPAGWNYIIETATNLSASDWLPEFKTNSASGSFLFVDPVGKKHEQYYRVSLGP